MPNNYSHGRRPRCCKMPHDIVMIRTVAAVPNEFPVPSAWTEAACSRPGAMTKRDPRPLHKRAMGEGGAGRGRAPPALPRKNRQAQQKRDKQCFSSLRATRSRS